MTGPKKNGEPTAIGVRPNPDHKTILVGPVSPISDGYEFADGYKPSRCSSVASARRAVTRWKDKLNLKHVVGEELMTDN